MSALNKINYLTYDKFHISLPPPSSPDSSQPPGSSGGTGGGEVVEAGELAGGAQ